LIRKYLGVQVWGFVCNVLQFCVCSAIYVWNSIWAPYLKNLWFSLREKAKFHTDIKWMMHLHFRVLMFRNTMCVKWTRNVEVMIIFSSVHIFHFHNKLKDFNEHNSAIKTVIFYFDPYRYSIMPTLHETKIQDYHITKKKSCETRWCVFD